MKWSNLGGEISWIVLAQLLGKLVSEPAMPPLMLLTRQLFEELKNAYASSILWRSHDIYWCEMWNEMWNVKCEKRSIDRKNRKKLLFINEKWDRLDGQSSPPNQQGHHSFEPTRVRRRYCLESNSFPAGETKSAMISSTESFEMNEVSSTAREARSIWLTVKEIPDAILRNTDVMFETGKKDWHWIAQKWRWTNRSWQ